MTVKLAVDPAEMAARTVEASSPYARALLEQAPRVLSLLDRERLSPTAGCMDRTYWAWKFVDFPGARYQEGLCVLAFLYSTGMAGNSFYGSPALAEWIASGLRFWSQIQHRDGSFDEAYPYERSLAATAFTSFYVAEALGLASDALPRDVVARTHETLARAGHWLCRNDETHGFLSNHQAAAAAALRHIHDLTGDAAFQRRSRYFTARILARQSNEGWYEEYGGADPGYQSHGSFYLARLWELTQDDELAASIERSMTFLAHFVHADGSIGGEYASRNTQTYYPAAFEMFARQSGAASWIAETMRPSVSSAAAAGLRAIDVHNIFPVLNNLVFAYRARAAMTRTVEPAEPSASQSMVWFPQAGIARVRRDRYDAYIGVTKGGVVKVFDRRTGRLAYSDCGYIGALPGGANATTQFADRDRCAHVKPNRVEVSGAFIEASRPVMRPARFAAFRLFSLTVGRLAGVGRWLKKQLVRALIYRRRPLDAHFRRVVEFEDDRVVVVDEIGGRALSRFTRLEWGEVFTTIHMGSARYFVANELDAHAAADARGERTIDPIKAAAGMELRRVVSFD
jgi:hypothetical protein